MNIMQRSKKRVGSARLDRTVKFQGPNESTKHQKVSLVRLEGTNLSPRAMEELKKHVKKFMPSQTAESMQ
jgi:hypothetical protein